MTKPIHITVRDGAVDIFEGNQVHWADCFFANAHESEIRCFCSRENWSCIIRPLTATEYMSLSISDKQFLRELNGNDT